jgi:hypothetical protein
MKKPDVIIPKNHPNPPEDHEIEAAWILARHFNTIVEFIIPTTGYGIKSPDCLFINLIWEIKSPVGNSKKNTIKNQFDNAKGKRKQLVIDGRRAKRLSDEFIISKVRYELKRHRSIKRLIYITKDEKVLEIK